MDHTLTITTQPRAHTGLLRRIGKRLLRWNELARQRTALRQLDERTLRDMGISRHDALSEARRPFWDDPHG